MQVISKIKYLQGSGMSSEDILLMLKADHGIEFNINLDYRLVVLNYSQINSSKFDPVSRECRSLVLCLDDLSVVSRSFDRFFNYGEQDTGYNCRYLTAFSKEDGSIIGVFFYKGEWLYRTRSMIMPTGTVNGAENMHWPEFIEASLGWSRMREALVGTPEDLTYIFEACGRENHVVHEYPDYCGFLLSVRKRIGAYYDFERLDIVSEYLGIPRPAMFKFESMRDCVYAASKLPDLQEGYVWYNRHGEPVCKVKNPAYVAAHYLRGERLKSPKKLLNMVLEGELDEYLSVFPQDRDLFEPYVLAIKSATEQTEAFFKEYHELDRKSYAALASREAYCTLAMSLFDGQSCITTLRKMLKPGRLRLLNKFKV